MYPTRTVTLVASLFAAACSTGPAAAPGGPDLSPPIGVSQPVDLSQAIDLAATADLLAAATPDLAPACDPGPFGGAHFPPACRRPFADSSPFNTPLPTTPRVHANSPAIVARILGDIAATKQPANLIATVDHAAGWPTYYSTAADPLFQITCSQFGGNCSAGGVANAVHVPAGAIHQGGCASPVGADRHLTIVDQASGWEYDLWQVDTCPMPNVPGALAISWGGRARSDGDGLDTDGGQGMASHFANLAGRVRAEELAAGEIRHALSIVINCDNGTFVYPAKAHDQLCAKTTNAPPMGSRLQLAMTDTEIDALPVPAWKKTLLHAMSRYGMFFGDTGSSFYFDIQLEGGLQYTTAGAPDAWLAFAMANNWPYYAPDNDYVGGFHANDDGINWDTMVWSRLRVLDPCVTLCTC